MIRFRPRRLAAAGLAILVLCSILGMALAVVTDREYVLTHGQSPAAHDVEHSNLPDWIKGRRHDAIRFLHDGSAILTMMGVGLAVSSIRPYVGGVRRGRLGAGHIAAVLTSVVGMAFVLGSLLDRTFHVPSPPMKTGGPMPLGVYFNLYHAWYELRPQITWAILGAWAFLAATGRWRPPIDRGDRLGRWLGWAWIALMLWQGVIFVIVWC